MIFLEIPRETPQYVYVFGIGLKEALYMRYGRTDIDIKRYPTRDDIGAARPGFDSVLRYNASTGVLEQLRARRGSSGSMPAGPRR